MRHASGLSCHAAADAVRFSAKKGDGFLLLVLNFNVIHAGQFALMLHRAVAVSVSPAKPGRRKSIEQPEATAASPRLLQA